MSRPFRLLPVLALLSSLVPVHAQESRLPMPRAVIYPGDVITETMLEDHETNPQDVSPTDIRTRAAIVGKIARRTLLPDRPIPAGALDQPRLVAVGAQVKIVYSEGGLRIVAFGVAQQAGGAGDLVRVRNLDSGLFVIGRVQDDGSIRVGEG